MSNPAESCAICLSDYTPKRRVKVQCQYCPEAACRGCQQQAILNSYEDPHCFSCKRGWSDEFMAQHFPLSFRNDTLRKHRRKVLLERQKAMLPAMQVFAQAWRQLGEAQKACDAVDAEALDLRHQTKEMLLKMDKAYVAMGPLRHKKLNGTITKDEKKELKQLSMDYKEARAAHEALVAERAAAYDKRYRARRVVARWQQMFDTGVDPGEPGTGGGAAAATAVVRREFLMRCPAADCRGFLSTSYKCGVCDHYTCPDCLEHLGPSKEVAHTCDANTVETAKAIKKETRPCPKCGARIFKIDGCDQMYCTVEGCQTAFSWQTGQVVSGRIHNPHYYEWLRRVHGGQAPREPGDIPGGGGGCGPAGADNLPGGWEFTRAVLRAGLTTSEKNWLLAIHRAVGDIEYARVPNFPTAVSPTMYKLLNVQHLLGKIDEANWQREMELMEAAFNRKKEIGLILSTLITAAKDLLRTIFQRLGGPYQAARLPLAEELPVLDWIRETALPELKALRDYTNQSFRTLAKTKHMAVPQIGELWEWMPLRALYNPPAAQKGLTREQAALRDEIAELNGRTPVEDDGPPPLGDATDEDATPDIQIVE